MRGKRFRWGLAAGLGVGASVLLGQGVAAAAPDSADSANSTRSEHTRTPSARGPAPRAAATEAPVKPTRARRVAPEVSVQLPPMPVTDGQAFTVSPDAVTGVATGYVAGGGDPGDNARFFFGDLPVASLDTLASAKPTPDQTRVQMGNLAASGYFGGVWLRDNLRDTPSDTPAGTGAVAPSTPGGAVSAAGLRMFDAFAAGLTGLATSPVPAVTTAAAHASVPVLLALYGYNKGYLDYLLENPPAGVASMQDTLSCKGFLSCTSSAFPAEIATRYDGALTDLETPATLPWAEMAAWTSALENFTGAGRFVWGQIASVGAFSPVSYAALVDLSSAYLMISKGAVLASMQAYADSDADLASSALLLQAGLWMWSGAYFAGLASDAPRGTTPSIVVAAN